MVGGTCQVNATLRADGVVVHDGTLQRIIIGERDRTTSPRTEALAAVLGRTSLDWTLSTDIEQDIWEKMVLLSALAAMTCLFRGTVAEIIAAPGGLEAMTRTLATNIDIVAREGHPIRPATEAVVRGRLTDPAGTLSASMLWRSDRRRVQGRIQESARHRSDRPRGGQAAPIRHLDRVGE